MKPGPRLISNIILDAIEIDARPNSLEKVIVDIIENNNAWDLNPIEKAHEWRDQISSILKNEYNRCIEQGRQPRFAFNSSSEYKIQGACFIEPIDSDDVKAQKSRRLWWKKYYTALRNIDSYHFERLSTKILNLIGVQKPKLTPYSSDQGIDFYGRISFGDLIGHGPIFPVFESDLVVWMIGQAKHYIKSKVATPDIRELVGSAELGKSKTFAKSGLYSDLNIRVCDPVIMLFFSTGEISADGWELCRRAGVVAMDGEMLANFLADKSIAIVEKDGAKEFESRLFEEWLFRE